MIASKNLSILSLALFLGASALSPAFAGLESRPEFFFKDGDRIAILGDSITEPHTSYAGVIEAYTLARFPKWKLTFRNVGWAGDTSALTKRQTAVTFAQIGEAQGDAQKQLARQAVQAGLDRDLFPFKPTAVTINFGMNDGGWGAVSDKAYNTFIACQTASTEMLKAKGIRVALVAPKPMEKPEPNLVALPNNVSLAKLTGGLEMIAKDRGVVFVNGFAPLLEVLAKAHGANPKASVFGGDGVHPNYKGSVLMAWAILKGLGAPALVSSAEIDAAKAQAGAVKGCAISQLKVANGVVSFQRSDDALPLPLLPEAEAAMNGAAILDDLSRYELKVTGLTAPRYQVSIDGEKAAEFTKEQLAAGCNLSQVPGPIARQLDQLGKAINAKNEMCRARWRNVQVYEVQLPAWAKSATVTASGLEEARAAELARLDGEIANREKEVDALRQPKPHTFEISPQP